MTNSTTAVSAPSAPVSALSAIFPKAPAEQLERIARNGFSASSAVFDDAVFYSDCFGGLISLSALRRDYEEHTELTGTLGTSPLKVSPSRKQTQSLKSAQTLNLFGNSSLLPLVGSPNATEGGRKSV